MPAQSVSGLWLWAVAVAAAGVLSVNARAPPSIAVVSVATPDVLATYQAAINSKQCYCLLHGYTFELDTNLYAHNRTPHWNKVPAIERLLPWFDWVVYLDADAVITNSSVRLEQYIAAAVTSGAAGGPSSQPDIIFSDGTEVNTGAFFVRSTDWSKRFLRLWWDMYDHQMASQSYYLWVFEQAGMLEATLRVAAATTHGKHRYTPNHCLRPELDRYVRLNNCWRLELARMGFPYCHRSNQHIHFHCGEGGAGTLRGFNQKNGIGHPVYASFYRPNEIWRPGDFVAHVLTARASLPILQLYAPAAMFDHPFGTCPWQQVPPPPTVNWVVSVPDSAHVCQVNPPCLRELWAAAPQGNPNNNSSSSRSSSRSSSTTTATMTRPPRFVWKSPWTGYQDAPEEGSVHPAPTYQMQAEFMQFPMEGDGSDGKPLFRTFSYLPTDDVWSRHTDFCVSNSMDCFEGWANFQAAKEHVKRVPWAPATPPPRDAAATPDGDDEEATLLHTAGFPSSADGPAPWHTDALSPPRTGAPALALKITTPRWDDHITGICCQLQVRLQMQTPSVMSTEHGDQIRHLLASIGAMPPTVSASSSGGGGGVIAAQNVDGDVCFNLTRSYTGGNGASEALLTEHCVSQQRREMLMLTLPEALWRPSVMVLVVWWKDASHDMRLLTQATVRFSLNPSNPADVEYLWRPFPLPASREMKASDHPLPPPPVLRPRPGYDVEAALSPADAFVTLIWGDGYIPAVVTLARSIELVGSSRVLVVLVSALAGVGGGGDDAPPAVPSVSAAGLATLQASPNIKVVFVAEFDDLTAGSRMPRLGSSIWLKLRVWQLVEYRCVVFVDADSLLIRNVDHLFLLCNPDGVQNGLEVAPPRGMGADDVGGMPLLAVVQSPDKWLNFSYAGASTFAGEYRNAHTVGGFFVTKPATATFNTMRAVLGVSSSFVFAEASFLDKFFEHVKVLLPHTYMCIAEGLDHFYRRPDLACDVVDFQSCGKLHWKPWDARPPPDSPDTICRFMPTDGYRSAIAAWRGVYQGVRNGSVVE